MMNNIRSTFLLFFSFLLISAKADMVYSVNKTIKNRKTYHMFTNKEPISIPIEKKDIDFIRESGVILSNKLQSKLKGKKTPEELKLSMAKAKGLTDAKIEQVLKRKIKRVDIESEPIIGKGFVLKKDTHLNKKNKQKNMFEELY